MSNAVLVNKVNHIIIDNLQFMMGCQVNEKYDKLVDFVVDYVLTLCRLL